MYNVRLLIKALDINDDEEENTWKRKLDELRHQRGIIPKKIVNLKELEDKIDFLYLLNNALIMLLQEKKLFESAELKRIMDEIDLRDGKKDGKIK